MSEDRSMPFEWRGWLAHVRFLLQRELTEAETERAKGMFFDNDCPTHVATVLYYGPSYGAKID